MKIERVIGLFVVLLLAAGRAWADGLEVVDTSTVSTLASMDSMIADLTDDSKMVKLVRKTVRGFDRLDTNYIEPQHYEFSVMAQATRNYEDFILSSDGLDIRFSPDQPIKLGPYFGWRWAFLGYTFDLKNLHLFGNDKKMEIGFSLYSSQVGIDLYYRRTGSDYKLREVRSSRTGEGVRRIDADFDGLSVGLTGINAYYIFNHGRFSYPAAFSQSTCQKISCGSLLAGLGFMHNTLELDYDKLHNMLEKRLGHQSDVQLDSAHLFDKIRYYDFNLSLGYAYNWVMAKNWLFCASLQGAACYKSSAVSTKGMEDGFTLNKVIFDVLGRSSLVYNNTRWYVGLCLVMRTNRYRTSLFSANNVFGNLNAYIGYNFMAKKKYRKNKERMTASKK